MTEHAKAVDWLNRCGLDRNRLAELTGYSAITIWWFLQGKVPPKRNEKSGGTSRKVKPWVWLRWKRACGDVDAEINGRKPGQRFDW